MQKGDCLMFHVDQTESETDAHVRFSYEEVRELFDTLSALCEKSEVSENLAYVRKVLELALKP